MDKIELLWARTRYNKLMLNDSSPSLHLNNITVNASQHVRVLGVYLSSDLSLDKHVSSVSATCFYHLRQLRLIQRSLDADSAATLVLAFVTSHVDYCNAILDAAPKDNNRQATTSVKRCCMSHQWHQKVWSGTITTDAPGVTLAGHSQASKLQAGSADPPVSARQGASVLVMDDSRIRNRKSRFFLEI